jgi:hypothetical protein
MAIPLLAVHGADACLPTSCALAALAQRLGKGPSDGSCPVRPAGAQARRDVPGARQFGSPLRVLASAC